MFHVTPAWGLLSTNTEILHFQAPACSIVGAQHHPAKVSSWLFLLSTNSQWQVNSYPCVLVPLSVSSAQSHIGQLLPISMTLRTLKGNNVLLLRMIHSRTLKTLLEIYVLLLLHAQSGSSARLHSWGNWLITDFQHHLSNSRELPELPSLLWSDSIHCIRAKQHFHQKWRKCSTLQLSVTITWASKNLLMCNGLTATVFTPPWAHILW